MKIQTMRSQDCLNAFWIQSYNQNLVVKSRYSGRRLIESLWACIKMIIMINDSINRRVSCTVKV